MKILHTADWHLGQNLYEKKRIEEHRLFFDWLLKSIKERDIDILIVSGDIYDNGNPPNYAKEEFYNFLSNILKTNCKHVVIVGGNHDSVSMLNAPQKILSNLNINIIGGIPQRLENQLIEIKNNDELEAVICAIPFLRDSEIHYTFVSDMKKRETNIKLAIVKHYEDLAEICENNYSKEIPIIATGHLYTAKATSSESEKDIYIGNLGKVEANQFPERFDYIALGHLHRQQRVGGKETIRYSGSPLPMSFSEYEDNKYLIEIEFVNKKISRIDKLEIPKFRKLWLLKGNYNEILKKLNESSPETNLKNWCEIQITDKSQLTTEEKDHIYSISSEKRLEILAVKTLLNNNFLEEEKVEKLEELKVDEVFDKKCEAELPESEIKEVQTTFKELINIMEEKDTK